MLGRLFGIALVVLGLGVYADDSADRYRAVTQHPFDDVLADINFAISQHNFRITGGNHIGGAIGERLGKSFPRSEIIHFCNLEYARRMLEAAPDNLLHMPCKIVVYERNGEVVIETQLLPEHDANIGALNAEINGMLREIVDYAAQP
ncbi:MAG: DUF302 domain-containing protein [Gammaproteobacteria bacterium]